MTHRSEPEVQIVLGVAKTMKPHVWLNIHSGMEAMFTPWDHRAEVSSVGWSWPEADKAKLCY